MTTQNTNNSRSWMIFGAVGAFVIVAALAAVFLSGSDDPDEVGMAAAGISETRPVSVSGTPLPLMPELGADAALGLTIPEVTGQSFDGTPVEIKNDGRPKIILFLAHW